MKASIIEMPRQDTTIGHETQASLDKIREYLAIIQAREFLDSKLKCGAELGLWHSNVFYRLFL